MIIVGRIQDTCASQRERFRKFRASFIIAQTRKRIPLPASVYWKEYYMGHRQNAEELFLGRKLVSLGNRTPALFRRFFSPAA